MKPTGAAGWKPSQTLHLDGLRVELSQPVLVARDKGYLWFPSLIRLADGELLAVMSHYADVHTNTPAMLASWSGDGGLTWSTPIAATYGQCPLTLPDGSTLMLPYYLYPKGEGVLGADCQLCPKGKRELKVIKDGVTVSGWPRRDRSFEPKLGLSGFVFNGQTVRITGGGYLTTLYGYFEGAARYNLMAAESQEGRAWKIRSVIADENCKLAGAEGPCESAICRMKDGRLMCVFRLASATPYGQCFSSDDGKTWTEPKAMDGVFSVEPSLAVFDDGAIALSGGRPGVFVWLNADGTGKRWQRVDLAANHKLHHPAEPAEKTSSYTEIVALSDKALMVIYDNVPHGWEAIPADSAATNSVWVVRLTVEKDEAK